MDGVGLVSREIRVIIWSNIDVNLYEFNGLLYYFFFFILVIVIN